MTGINVRVPEGHTIHRLAGRHRALFAGRPVAVSSPQGRFADGAAPRRRAGAARHLRPRQAPAAPLRGRRGAARPPRALRQVHRRRRRPPPPPVGEVRLRMASGGTGWTCAARRRASCSTRCRSRPCTPGSARIRCADHDGGVRRTPPSRKSDRPLMALLMDQSVVAGAGLIYVTESLFRAGLRPTVPGPAADPPAVGHDLAGPADADARRGPGRPDRHRPQCPPARGHGPRPARRPARRRGLRVPPAGLPCLICGTPVRTAELNARNAYWCPTCQATR